MQQISTLMILGFLAIGVSSQATEIRSHDDHPLHGHWMPADDKKHAILIVAGSGPTDKDGNQAQYKTNTYLQLATALNQAGYGVLRYDKRGVGDNAFPDFDMSTTTIHDYAKDVASWVTWLKTEETKVTVIGHSIGGLLALLAQQEVQADQLILLASVATSGAETLKRQLSAQPEFVSQQALPLLDRLQKGESIPLADVPQFLHNLFHPNLQHFVRSFMNLEPRQYLSQVKQPVLTIIGDTDLQITVEETQAMTQDLVPITTLKGMNHVLKVAPAERLPNLLTYNQPELPLHPELLPVILNFLQDKGQ